MIHDKDPTAFGLLTYAWVFALSAWGGAVNFIHKVRNGTARPLNVMELVGELMTSAFSGIITFWLCNAADIQPLVTAALVGISGHMGSRTIYRFEKWAEAHLPIGKGGE